MAQKWQHKSVTWSRNNDALLWTLSEMFLVLPFKHVSIHSINHNLSTTSIKHRIQN